MKNKYTAPEVIEVGSADALILGEGKVGDLTEMGQPFWIPANDLDD